MPEMKYGDISLERMVRAVERVKNRLLRAASALQSAGVPYAVVGGNAVAAWVSSVDEAAARNTQDVDIILERSDLDRATVALSKAGFVRRHSAGVEMFLDGPGAKAREAVHVVFAGEKVRPEYLAAVPRASESEALKDFRVISLEALVRMKLTSFRLKDQVHLQDLRDVGLIDASWCAKFTPELSGRLAQALASE